MGGKLPVSGDFYRPEVLVVLFSTAQELHFQALTCGGGYSPHGVREIRAIQQTARGL